MGCPHIFPTFIHPKKNGNDTAGYDFRLLEIQNPLASNFLTFVENMKDNELLSGNTRWRLSDSRRIVTSFHPETDGEKPADGRFVYLFIRLLYQSSLPLYRAVKRMRPVSAHLLQRRKRPCADTRPTI